MKIKLKLLATVVLSLSSGLSAAFTLGSGIENIEAVDGVDCDTIPAVATGAKSAAVHNAEILKSTMESGVAVAIVSSSTFTVAPFVIDPEVSGITVKDFALSSLPLNEGDSPATLLFSGESNQGITVSNADNFTVNTLNIVIEDPSTRPIRITESGSLHVEFVDVSDVPTNGIGMCFVATGTQCDA